tara:strand:+ start:403 stop:1002 length:600 start_codon:yes stop_codon:yes gene_type:complete
MTIRVRGTIIVDDQRNIDNIVNFSAAGNLSGSIIATKTQAEAGTLNTKIMTPQRVAEAIAALFPEAEEAGSVIKSIQRGTTYFSGSSPITVNLSSAVNASKAFITSSVRSDIIFDQSAFEETIRGDYPGSSQQYRGIISGSAAATASVRFQRPTGNNDKLIVQAGSGFTKNYTDWRGQVMDTLTLSPKGNVEWEVIEFN